MAPAVVEHDSPAEPTAGELRVVRTFWPESYMGPDGSARAITEILPGRAWVVSGFLTEEECDEWMRIGEDHGIEAPGKRAHRTAKRTKYFHSKAMAELAGERLPGGLVTAIEATGMGTAVRGLHPNWRMVRYDEGDQFPAHQDQQDELATRLDSGHVERARSSHTLLISLSGCSGISGGATRFFPTGRCDEAVDVHLARGHALIFEQKGLMHSGMPVEAGTKYVAQAGLLRALPATGKAERPWVFKYAFGVTQEHADEQHLELLRRQGQRVPAPLPAAAVQA